MWDTLNIHLSSSEAIQVPKNSSVSDRVREFVYQLNPQGLRGVGHAMRLITDHASRLKEPVTFIAEKKKSKVFYQVFSPKDFTEI